MDTEFFAVKERKWLRGQFVERTFETIAPSALLVRQYAEQRPSRDTSAHHFFWPLALAA